MNLLEFIKKPVSSDQLLNMVNESVAENEKTIIEVQEKQWDKGQDSKGSVIGKYKKFTEKKAKEQPIPNTPKIAGQPYNLNWSGDLRKKTTLESKVKSKDIVLSINSKSSVVSRLFKTIQKHGLINNPSSIFGIQQNNNMDKITKAVNQDTLRKLKKRYV